MHILKKCHKPVGNGKAQPKEGEFPFNCVKCGARHLQKRCPAFAKMYHSCKQKSHFSKSKTCPKLKNLSGTCGVHEVTERGTAGSESKVHDVDFFIATITAGDKNSAWYSTVDVEGTVVKFKLDTDAECCVLPSHVYYKLNNKPPLQKTHAVLSSYCEFKVKPQGQVNLNCQANGSTTTLNFYVAQVQSPPILGLNACQKLKLVKKVDSVVTGSQVSLSKEKILQDYPDVFKGLGSMEGKYRIELDESVEPVSTLPAKRNMVC